MTSASRTLTLKVLPARSWMRYRSSSARSISEKIGSLDSWLGMSSCLGVLFLNAQMGTNSQLLLTWAVTLRIVEVCLWKVLSFARTFNSLASGMVTMSPSLKLKLPALAPQRASLTFFIASSSVKISSPLRVRTDLTKSSFVVIAMSFGDKFNHTLNSLVPETFQVGFHILLDCLHVFRPLRCFNDVLQLMRLRLAHRLSLDADSVIQQSVSEIMYFYFIISKFGKCLGEKTIFPRAPRGGSFLNVSFSPQHTSKNILSFQKLLLSLHHKS